MQKYYRAEMDRMLRITTRVVYATFLFPPALLFYLWYRSRYLPGPACRPAPPGIDRLLPPIMLVFVVLEAVTAYVARALAPRGYLLNDVELVVDRAMRPIKVPLREIREFGRAEDGLMRRSLRVMGTAGYYGYYGLFWNRKLGKFRLYATRTRDLVSVRTERTLYVLSPDDSGDFLAALAALKRGSPAGGTPQSTA